MESVDVESVDIGEGNRVVLGTMSASTQSLPPPPSYFGTWRQDTWWWGPILTGLGLLLFVAYSTWAALQGEHYHWGPYLSPFYSPLIEPSWWPFSPAFLILWAPAGFRFTCYYYRKAYYRAFFHAPPACAVAGRPQNYLGERAFFLFQNLHRYFLYLALLFVFILAWDAIAAYRFANGFGVGVGSLVLTMNVLFLGGFTFGCNSLRHLVGGNVDCFSCVRFGGTRYRLWRGISFFNRSHMEWAWLSLFWVGFADLYVRLVSMGVITDLRLI